MFHKRKPFSNPFAPVQKKHRLSPKKQIDIKSIDLIKNDNPEKFISEVRLSVPPEFYHQIFNKLEKYPYSVTHILSSDRKKSIKDLHSPQLTFISFDSEFYWAKSVILRNIEYFKEFTFLAKRYSSALLLGEYQIAGNLLDEIESQFGYSLWLVKNKIAFLQLTAGLESQKKYTQSIKSELKMGSLPRFVVHWTSLRNEEQTSYTRFLSQIDPILKTFSDTTQLGYREYMKYHLLAIHPTSIEEQTHILRLEYSCSLIDYYEAFIGLLRLMVVDDDENIQSKVYNVLTKLNVNDNKIEFLKLMMGIKPTIPPITSKDSITVYNDYLKGEHSLSYTKAKELIKTNPNDAILILVCSLSKSFLPKDNSGYNNASLLDTLLLSQVEIIKNGLIGSSKQFNDLKKTFINFSYFQWASSIEILLFQEKELIFKSDKTSEVIALKSCAIHPMLIDFFENKKSLNEYKNICENLYTKKLLENYPYSFADIVPSKIPTDINHEYKDFISAIIYLNNQQFGESSELAERLLNSQYSYYKRRGYGILSVNQLKTGDYNSACKTIAQSYLNEKSFIFLPIQDFLDIVKVGTAEWRAVNANIDLPIVLDAYYKNFNKNLEAQRRFAYEDFLLKNGYLKPSDLFENIEKFDLNSVIYYLRFVCIESVMDTSRSFQKGSIEVIEERLLICRFLVTIDGKNEPIFKEEINDLVRRLVITNRKQEVDKSRIYIDVQSVKEWAEIELKENYGRYTAYLTYGINLIDSKKEDKNSNAGSMSVPENEVFELLKFMIEEIRDSYLSPSFGLDRFLSTRIRHGILESHLRRPIQDQQLITKKESKTGPYLKNEYWLSKLKVHSSSQANELDKELTKFSEAYDKLIHQITNEWLQIKRDSDKNGLFDFNILENDINNISLAVNKDTTLTEFINIVVSALESSLILILINIREILNNKAKTQAKKLLTNLQESQTVQNVYTGQEMNRCINQGRIDLQNQFEKVIEWFVPPSSGNSAPYIIEDAIVVAEALVRELNSNFKFNLESDEQSNLPIHGQLPIFVDIFVNIFQNIIKSSGLENPEANIKIWVINDSERLSVFYVKVWNNLGDDMDTDKLEIDLKAKIQLLNMQTYDEYLAKEGNSGLFKIHKSVKSFKAIGSDIKPTIDFGIEQNTYQITFSVPFRLITLEDDINKKQKCNENTIS